MNIRKNLRRYLARAWLQNAFRLMYRVSLVGMNYGGAGSARSSGDAIALEMLRDARRDVPLVVFDVGANVGSYVVQVLETLGRSTTVYAFEPSSVAFQQLQHHVGQELGVHLAQLGIGAEPSTTTLFAAVPGSVLGSTFAHPLQDGLQGERITLTTLDEFCREHAIRHVDLLKLDLEGGELDALRGASRMLEADGIDLVQFEFGQPSIGARTFFADVFKLLDPRYEIYRVLPHGLVRLAAYHETLEVFMSTNYLAVSRVHAADLVGRR